MSQQFLGLLLIAVFILVPFLIWRNGRGDDFKVTSCGRHSYKTCRTIIAPCCGQEINEILLESDCSPSDFMQDNSISCEGCGEEVFLKGGTVGSLLSNRRNEG